MRQHEMRLRDRPFGAIESGDKTLEIRLLDEKRRAIQVGDRIVFTHIDDAQRSIAVEVINLIEAPTFLELFNKIAVVQAGWPIGATPEQAAQDMAKYYQPEEQARYGTVAIEIKKI